MSLSVTFNFIGSLNDFLRVTQKNNPIQYKSIYSTSVKDAIESIGIPHTEVDRIIVNNTSVDFSYLLSDADVVEVYPFDTHTIATPSLLKPTRVRFILDVHLGSLARAMRMLGINTMYENNLVEKDIVLTALNEERIVLTRDVGLLKHKHIKYGYWLRSTVLEEQLTEVINRYQLKEIFKPFTRCIACNGVIQAVSKESVIEKLPPKTKEFFDEFYQCVGCKRVYWKGSHYERMQEFINKLLN